MSSSANERPASEHRILGRGGAAFRCHCPKGADHRLNEMSRHLRSTEEVADELVEVIRQALEQAWDEGYGAAFSSRITINPYRVSK